MLKGIPPTDFKPEQSIGFLLRVTQREFSKVLQMHIAFQGVTLGMWYFLRVLWEGDGISQRELSRRIGMMEPTTVNALMLMERKGLIIRKRDPKDKRRRMVYLTKRGRALKTLMVPYAYEVNRIALDGVSEKEVEQLRRTLSKMKRNLEAFRGSEEAHLRYPDPDDVAGALTE